MVTDISLRKLKQGQTDLQQKPLKRDIWTWLLLINKHHPRISREREEKHTSINEWGIHNEHTWKCFSPAKTFLLLSARKPLTSKKPLWRPLPNNPQKNLYLLPKNIFSGSLYPHTPLAIPTQKYPPATAEGTPPSQTETRSCITALKIPCHLSTFYWNLKSTIGFHWPLKRRHVAK